MALAHYPPRRVEMPLASLLTLAPAAVLYATAKDDVGLQVFAGVLGGVTLAALLAIGRVLLYAAVQRARETARQELVEAHRQLAELQHRLERLEDDRR